MTDERDRDNDWPLRSIYLYLTPECNLACRHCWIAPRFKNVRTAEQYIPLPLISSVVRQALPLGLASIKLTGGEPLLHPDVPEILALAREHGLEVNVETNGTLVTPEFAASLARSGRRFVSVSLDGADAPTHEWVRGVPGSFDRACEGIRLLAEAGLRPQVIMSLFRQNVDQIALLVAMAEEMGAGSVKFNIVQPTARGVRVHEEGQALSIGELIAIARWVEGSLSKDVGIPLHVSIPPAFRPLGSLFGAGGAGCGRCTIRNILGVLGDGSYALCGIGETTPEMVFGHAARDSLETIWRTHPVIAEIRNGIPDRLKGICEECAMKGVCLGSCLAQNYSRSRDLWAPYWFCGKADEEGLFPPARRLGPVSN
ncbi:MAG: SynChlorMet cassette radical SAM/SPASM protein ScmF [Methanospirillum sp.]